MANSSPVYDWFQERLEIQDIADDIGSKYVPPHVNIFYCLGGITLVCFLIQFATGFAMTFYYKLVIEGHREPSRELDQEAHQRDAPQAIKDVDVGGHACPPTSTSFIAWGASRWCAS